MSVCNSVFLYLYMLKSLTKSEVNWKKSLVSSIVATFPVGYRSFKVERLQVEYMRVIREGKE